VPFWAVFIEFNLNSLGTHSKKLGTNWKKRVNSKGGCFKPSFENSILNTEVPFRVSKLNPERRIIIQIFIGGRAPIC